MSKFDGETMAKLGLSIIEKREARIEELEVALRAALSFVQERHPDHSDGHAQMVIAAIRGALRKRERD